MIATRLLTVLSAVSGAPITVGRRRTPALRDRHLVAEGLPKRWITGQLAGVCIDNERQHHFVNRGTSPRRRRRPDQGAGGHQIQPGGRPDRRVGRPGPARHRPQLRRRPGQQYLDHHQRRWHDPEIPPDGKLLLQIGKKGKFNSVDGTRRARAKRRSRTSSTSRRL